MRRRRLLRAAAAGLGVLGVVVLGAAPAVWWTTRSHLYSGVDGVPTAPVAIVLGAGVGADGRPSPFLAERIDLAVRLYRAGRVKALLMSGDISRTDYDEVTAMAKSARDQGVPPEAVVTDHAGFDTYSSCYRARSVWGVRRAIVVSQAFHLPRAVWLCRRLGVDADGAATGTDATDATWRGWAREVPALDKAVLEVVTGRTPTFPGPREHALDAVVG